VFLSYNVETSLPVRKLTSNPFVNRNIKKTVHSYRTSTTKQWPVLPACQVGEGERKYINRGSIPGFWNNSYLKLYIRHLQYYSACRLIPQNHRVLSGGRRVCVCVCVLSSAVDTFSEAYFKNVNTKAKQAAPTCWVWNLVHAKYTGCFWNRRPYFTYVYYAPKQRRNITQTCSLVHFFPVWPL